jgi:2-methylisocitrate lyase-like PEP mutase family enzyme
VSRDEALAHGGELSSAVEIPVAADTENAFADDPAGVGETVRLACGTGLAGCSVEDWSGSEIYDIGLAVERIAAAAEAAHAGSTQLVLTARAENLVRERPDLADTIDRLQRYQEAGADVLFAPGLRALDDIHAVVSSVDRPVNVLGSAATPTVAELASVGVARISVGGAFAYTAYGALVDAANELRGDGTYSFSERVAAARTVIRNAFG